MDILLEDPLTKRFLDKVQAISEQDLRLCIVKSHPMALSYGTRRLLQFATVFNTIEDVEAHSDSIDVCYLGLREPIEMNPRKGAP